METIVRRGEIHWIEKAQSTYGSEQQNSRPALVVSNDIQNSTSDTVQVVYLTTKPKKELPTHVLASRTSNGNAEGSTILCENIFSISKMRFQVDSYYARLSDEDMEKVDKALLISLALTSETEENVSEEETSPETEADLQELTQVKIEAEFYKAKYNELLERIMRKAAI